MLAPVVFLDKDGTLVEDVPYNVDPARIVLTAGAVNGLRSLQDHGFRLAVATNQSGVARGFFPERALADIEARLGEMLRDNGVSLDGFFYCPHHPEGTLAPYAVACQCRKPAPGLLVAAAQRLSADLSECWMVGDILDDVEAGRRAGCRTVLIDNGNETEWVPGPLREPHHRAANVELAARIIVRAKQTFLKRAGAS